LSRSTAWRGKRTASINSPSQVRGSFQPIEVMQRALGLELHRDHEVLVAEFAGQHDLAGQVALVQPLHDDQDRALHLVVKAVLPALDEAPHGLVALGLALSAVEAVRIVDAQAVAALGGEGRERDAFAGAGVSFSKLVSPKRLRGIGQSS
jgi:hypothetical protein